MTDFLLDLLIALLLLLLHLIPTSAPSSPLAATAPTAAASPAGQETAPPLPSRLALPPRLALPDFPSIPPSRYLALRGQTHLFSVLRRERERTAATAASLKQKKTVRFALDAATEHSKKKRRWARLLLATAKELAALRRRHDEGMARSSLEAWRARVQQAMGGFLAVLAPVAEAEMATLRALSEETQLELLGCGVCRCPRTGGVIVTERGSGRQVVLDLLRGQKYSWAEYRRGLRGELSAAGSAAAAPPLPPPPPTIVAAPSAIPISSTQAQPAAAAAAAPSAFNFAAMNSGTSSAITFAPAALPAVAPPPQPAAAASAATSLSTKFTSGKKPGSFGTDKPTVVLGILGAGRREGDLFLRT